MGIDRNAPFLSTEARPGLAPIGLVVALRRREEPVHEMPRLQLPLPLPAREPIPRIAPDDDESRERSPTRGVNVFEMI